MNVEKFDPFIKAINSKKLTLTKKKLELDELTKSLDWFKSFNINNAVQELTQLKSSLIETELSITSNKIEIGGHNSKLNDFKKEKSPIWKVHHFFREDQKTIRTKIKNERLMVKILSNKIFKLENDQSNVNDKIKDLQKEINNYSSFEENKSKALIKNLALDIESETSEIEILNGKSKDLNEKLKPELEELSKLLAEITKLDRKIAIASSFEDELSSATTSYERAMAHQRCEQELGFSKPRQATSKYEQEKRTISRKIAKIEDRLKQLSDRYLKAVEKLVFDGNNLCYCGGEYIGLSALRKLVEIAAGKFPILIIFDSGIRGLEQCSDSDIRKAFPKNIELHVVATKEAADETIIKFSDDVSGCYVVTNDRFDDYPNSKVKIDNRMIRHEILPSKAFIHDLDISVVW